MDISIQVNEEKFAEVLKEELNAFTKEELHEICREGLVKCMSNPETFKHLFIMPNGYNYGNNYNDLLKEAAKKIDLSPCFTELQDKCITYLKENEKTIITDVFKEFFIQSLANTFFSNSGFTSKLHSELYPILNR